MPDTWLFNPTGIPVAISPQAYGQEYAKLSVNAAPYTLEADGRVAVVDVQGPLATASGALSYALLRECVAAAASSEAHTVALRIDSPGGEAHGCLETAELLRDMCAESGKRLVTHTEAKAESSAYAIAAAASIIGASPAAMVGSIGVFQAVTDLSRAHDAAGVTVSLIHAGARKVDGHPAIPLSDDARAAIQANVDGFAQLFYGWISQQRNATPEAIAALEAGIFLGANASAKGLIDVVQTWEQFLAMVADLPPGSILDTDTLEVSTMPDPNDLQSAEAPKDNGGSEESARAALQRAADNGDEKAKRALKAYDDEPEEKAQDETEEEPTAEEPGAEPEQVSAEARALAAEAVARAALLAGAPDEMKAALASAPLETVRDVVAALPKPNAVPVATAASTLERPPTRGVNAGTARPHIPADELSMRMGLVETEREVRVDGPVQTLGVTVPKEIR